MSQYTEQNKFALYQTLTFITDIVAFIQGNIFQIPNVRPLAPGSRPLFLVIYAAKPTPYEKIGKPLNELGPRRYDLMI